MSVDVVLNDIKTKMEKTLGVFRDELAGVRTGMASTALVDHLMVDCYGAAMPVGQVATVSAPEPRAIVIQPWDTGLLNAVAKAIMESNLGLVPNNDGKIIRIVVPPLSEERRKDLIKVVRKMAEDARVALRGVRRDANDKVKKMLKDKAVTEDEQRRAEHQIQDKTDAAIRKIDELLEKKEKDLVTI